MMEDYFTLLQTIEDEAQAADDCSSMMVIDPRGVLILCDVARKAIALHERVEMDESVGVCLSERVQSLNLGDALSKLRS